MAAFPEVRNTKGSHQGGTGQGQLSSSRRKRCRPGDVRPLQAPRGKAVTG